MTTIYIFTIWGSKNWCFKMRILLSLDGLLLICTFRIDFNWINTQNISKMKTTHHLALLSVEVKKKMDRAKDFRKPDNINWKCRHRQKALFLTYTYISLPMDKSLFKKTLPSSLLSNTLNFQCGFFSVTIIKLSN